MSFNIEGYLWKANLLSIFKKVRSIRSVAAESIQDDQEEFLALFQQFFKENLMDLNQ